MHCFCKHTANCTILLFQFHCFEQTVLVCQVYNLQTLLQLLIVSSEMPNTFIFVGILVEYRVREAEKRDSGRGSQIETDHSAFSYESDACCYADHREGNGKRRERE